MIIFFRKLRQNLLTENKFTKYLIYAIGEIILVVIGILIALQVNNWNELRKTDKNQEKYLSLLKVETINNLKEVEKYNKAVTRMNNWQKTIFSLIDGNHDTISESYLSEAFGNVFSYTYQFRYENSVLTEFKNSGELKNVKNDSIRKYLIELEPLVFRTQTQEEGVADQYQQMTEYLVTRSSLRRLTNDAGPNNTLNLPQSANPRKSNIDVLKQVEFENRLMRYMGTTNNLISNHYPALENHLKKIIEIIDEELK